MSEEDKFQHIDKWLGLRIRDYNSRMSELTDACKTADDSSDRPIFERIHVIDIAQRKWTPYASQAGRTISSISNYVGMMDELGKAGANLAKSGKEKMDLVEGQRADLAHRIASLSGLRANLTEQYLKQEGIIGDEK